MLKIYRILEKRRLRFGMYILGLVVIAIAFINNSCQSPNKEIKSPNIIWINAEDISPNWGCYGDTYATTPNIDKLAETGIVFNNAYATAPICSPARSCLITGMYATSLGTQHLRCEIERTDFIKTLPEYLSKAGYFTSNNGKTDYNFSADGVWNYTKKDNAPWRQRADDRPFFSMLTLGMTHEGAINITEKWENSTKDLPQELFHNPDNVPVPPYYPNTPEIRKVWSHYHDNITVYDRVVGEIIQNLKDDGLYEETIVFVFSDHGAGMPRYKRWLNITGLKVPFVAYVPEKYQHLIKAKQGSKEEAMVSFVDFAPTVLNLAGIKIPENMEGQTFMGENISPARTKVIGARSRADNMYEMSRAVVTGDYIYIRHYFPHLPYIQPGIIFSDLKESFRELRRLKNSGELHAEALKMWGTKPIEELYDLKVDPNELNNLATHPEYRSLMDSLKKQIHTWALKTHDSGFLSEAEYMIRSEGSTPYEMTHSGSYNLPAIIEAAEMVGVATLPQLIEKFQDKDSGVRYWAVIGVQAMGEKGIKATQALIDLLNDSSPSVQIAAAESLCRLDFVDEALPVLAKWMKDDRVWLALKAARSVELIGDKAKPLVPVLYEVLKKNSSTEPNATQRFKDFNFAAFTTWSVEGALHNCGEEIELIQ